MNDGTVLYALRSRLHAASRSAQMRELAGLDDEATPEPYAAAIAFYLLVAREALHLAREARELRAHRHVWGDDDWCIVCGADGRA